MKRIFICLVISAALLSVGCSTEPRRGSPAPVISSQPATETEVESVVESSATPVISSYPAREPKETAGAGNPAVVALLSSAGRQQRGGDLAAAAATVERALRIEPRNATLWHRLASLRLDQKRYQMAAELAAKSNSLVQGDDVLRRNNWRLIARARSALGDSKGARQALQKAQ